MQDTQTLRHLFLPKAVLKPMNSVADRAVPDGMIRDGYVPIHRFPFRVGREMRGSVEDGRFIRIERPRWLGGKPNNDLYLMDPGPGVQVSREHFQIEETAGGGYLLVDRGSSCGTTVGDTRLSPRNGVTSVALRNGDVIQIGMPESLYVYTFICDLGSQ